MLDVDEIQAHLETMNQAPRMTLDELDDAIERQGIQISPGVLERVKQSLREPRAPVQLSDRTTAAIERRSLDAPLRELAVDKAQEIEVFFWMRRNPERSVGFSEIGAETGLSAFAVSSAVGYLLDEGLVESQHEPRDLTRYRYEVIDFRGALKLFIPKPVPISASDV